MLASPIYPIGTYKIECIKREVDMKFLVKKNYATLSIVDNAFGKLNVN